MCIRDRGRPQREAFIKRRGEDKLVKIDRQIEAFFSRKPSKQRDEILKDLAHEREQVLRKYFDGGIELEPVTQNNSEQGGGGQAATRAELK